MGQRIPNRDRLPRELSAQGTELGEFVFEVALPAVEKGLFHSVKTLTTAQRMIKQHCDAYKPSLSSEHEVLCRSGEQDGQPYRAGCTECRFSQFSLNGFFVGEIIPASVLDAQA